MKILFTFFILILSLFSFADEVSVAVEGDETGTEVVVTPLDEPPSDIPRKPTELKTVPRWWKIGLFGLGLAPIEFLISTAVHEGSHAMVAAASGAEVTGYHPYPHREPARPFRFGDAHWYGNLTPRERSLTMAAPMFLDSAILGTYGGLLLGKALPDNRYAHMAMWVFAAGHWVNMGTHVVAKSEHTDTRKIERYFQEEHDLTVIQSRLAVRGSQALVLAAGGFFLYKGLRQIFKDTTRPRYESMDPVEDYDRRKADERKSDKKKSFIEKHRLFLSPSGDQHRVGLMFGGAF